jgi:hypothetical protein
MTDISELLRTRTTLSSAQILQVTDALKSSRTTETEQLGDVVSAAAALDPWQIMRIQAAAGEAKRLNVKVVDGRVDVHELTRALQASGRSPEQRMAIRKILAAAAFID